MTTQEGSNSLKIVLLLKEGRASVGVQREGADPVLELVDDFPEEILPAQVVEIIERARARWAEAEKYPEYQRPTPPPGPAPTPSPASSRGRPRQEPEKPKGEEQQSLF